jgi:hypothetical protein
LARVIGSSERLVHQHDPGVRRQRARHADPLLLAAAELPGFLLPVDPGVEIHQFQKLVDPGADARLGPAQFHRDRGDVLGHRHVREQADLLDDVADVQAQLDGVDGVDVAAVDVDGSGAGLDELVDHLHRGGLAAA